MAKVTDVNRQPATGAVAMFDLVAWLVAVMGYIVESDSDGSTYEADVPTNGRQVTHGGSGANGLANANAWIRFRDPGTREWIIQRHASNNTDWRIKATPYDGFLLGTPSATEVPSALDELILHGGGTDAAPTHSVFFPADASYRQHFVGFDVAEVSVYPWYMTTTFASGISAARTFFGLESLDPVSYPVLVGTRAVPTSGEPDPCVYIAGYATTSAAFQVRTTSGSWGDRTAPPGFMVFALNGSNGETEAFVSCQGFAYEASPAFADRGAPANSAATDGFGVNPLDGKDPMYPILVGRPLGLTTQVGHKGFCAHLRWRGVDRDYPDTLDFGGARFVYMSEMLVPFEDGTAPLT